MEVQVGSVEAIDPEMRRATVDGQDHEADALVVALGADLRPDLVPGLAAHGIDVWDRTNVHRARMAFEAFRGGRLVIAIFATPYACPPGPYELAMLAKERLDARGVEVEVEVVTPTPIALPVAGPVESRKLEDLLAEAGIGLALDHPATEVDEGELHFEEKPSRRFDLLFGVAPHRCPRLLVAAGLAEPDGWVKVDPASLWVTLSVTLTRRWRPLLSTNRARWSAAVSRLVAGSLRPAARTLPPTRRCGSV
jgi:sulfide:quinone oxidoreductase